MLTNLDKLGLQDGASQLFIVQDKWTTDPYKQQGGRVTFHDIWM